MMETHDWELSNSWECYGGDFIFLNCADCARQYAEDNNIELNSGVHHYSDEREDGLGVSECWACGHEFDSPPSCDGCGTYLRGNLTHEGRAYMYERLSEWPEWLVEYHLGEEGVRKQERLNNAECARDKALVNGVLVGYRTLFTGNYVCIECGNYCECNTEEE